MEPVRHSALIGGMPDSKILASVLKNGDPTVQVYVVGGAVRDFLFHQFHGQPNTTYKPKDTDLTTNLSEEEILIRLRSDFAMQHRIGVKQKESVDTFGVVFANVDGRGPYEIAPFRKDIGGSDGRRPDSVERGNIFDDAMRRDLTINNLYYDMEQEVILDFNPNGQGVTDIRNKTVRTVGNPFDRFEEDKLRVLRLVRFFSRFNSGRIIESLDSDTLAAIAKYKKLHDFRGMSAERIQSEFILGLAQSLNTENFLRNYVDLDLMPAVFPSIDLDLSLLSRLNNTKNHKVILALLLAKESNVGQILNTLKYSSSMFDAVEFLVEALRFSTEDAVRVLKLRDRRILKKKIPLTSEEQLQNALIISEISEDLNLLAQIIEDTERQLILRHLVTYEPLTISGESLMLQGFQKEQIGARQRELIQQGYAESLESVLN